MSRKRSELEFGSDSFLDVLANIVGILIILIVIAGARAARSASLGLVSSEEVTETAAPSAPVIVLPPEPDPNAPPPELAKSLRTIRQDLAALDRQAADQATTLQQQLARQYASQKEQAAAERELDRRAKALQGCRQEVASQQLQLTHRREELGALLAEFEEVRGAQPEVRKVKHELTPIGQTIIGDEIHFRLHKNRVAFIPLEELIERVKVQVERQKEWLSRHRRHEGSVGPAGGFTLNFVLERQSLSGVEQLRYGTNVYRVGVGAWELVPEPDLVSETAEEALRAGSRFASALQLATPRSAVTFWVYPDSFGLFRKLQSAAHGEGFIVSGRPLPEGVPIAGSPNGTRSTGQ
jgi:hypothetical protein